MASMHNLIIYLHIESYQWQTCTIGLSICTLNHIDGKHTQSNHLFVRHAYKGINGLTVGLIYICMYPIYQVCLRVWQKDTPKGYYFDNRWYTSVASASRVLGHTNITTTQKYAKITTEKIDKDLTMFGNRLNQSFGKISIAM